MKKVEEEIIRRVREIGLVPFESEPTNTHGVGEGYYEKYFFPIFRAIEDVELPKLQNKRAVVKGDIPGTEGGFSTPYFKVGSTYVVASWGDKGGTIGFDLLDDINNYHLREYQDGLTLLATPYWDGNEGFSDGFPYQLVWNGYQDWIDLGTFPCSCEGEAEEIAKKYVEITLKVLKIIAETVELKEA